MFISRIRRIIWPDITFTLILVMLIFYFVKVYQYSFNYQIYFNENYSLSFYSSLTFSLYLLWLIFKREISNFTVYSLIFLIILLFYSYLYPNRQELAVIFSVFLCFHFFFEIGLNNLKQIITIFFLLFVFNTLLCTYTILQKGTIEGIINNSGIIGIYSAIHLPILFYLVSLSLRKLTNTKKSTTSNILVLIILSLILIATLVIIIESNSRTALWTAILLILLQLNKVRLSFLTKLRFGNTLKLFFILGIVAIITILILQFYHLSQVKQASFSGRLLMFKIAYAHLFDNFWFGVGFGNFSWHFPQWQEDFLKTYRIGKEAHSLFNAGETYVILNEYLQLLISVGFFFFLVITVFIILIFKAKSKFLGASLFYLKCTIFGILFSGLTSYPFHVNLILLFFFCCISFCIRVDKRLHFVFIVKKRNPVFKLFFFILFSFSIFTSYVYLQKSNAVVKWHKIVSSDNIFKEKENMYNEIFPQLNNDGKFLADYGAFIVENISKGEKNFLNRSINLLEKAKTKFISKNEIESLGYAYWMKKDYQKSIHYFQWLDNYQPYLFEPKLALMHLYIELKNFKKAKEMALMITNMPPKVPSLRIEEIKKETQELIRIYGLEKY